MSGQSVAAGLKGKFIGWGLEGEDTKKKISLDFYIHRKPWRIELTERPVERSKTLSSFNRARYRKKLNKLLACADDQSFLIMIWAISAAQNQREVRARHFFEFPQEAVTEDITSKFFAHPWKLETLANELLCVEKDTFHRNQQERSLNCRHFTALVSTMNALTKLENAEDGITLRHKNVLRDMARLGQRQFDWQRGFISKSQYYLSHFIYGGEKSKEFFAKKYGITQSQFALSCFVLYTLYRDNPIFNRKTDLSQAGVSADTLHATLKLISIPHKSAREKAQQVRSGNGHISYKRSILREHPCISFGHNGELIAAPLIDLLILRSTSDMFYDMIKGGDQVRTEIGKRFEEYCFSFIQEMLPSYSVRPSYKYKLGKQKPDSPDIILNDSSGVSVIFECKATRMSYEARFSDDPVADARRGYEEIAKGVVQIWRYVSHYRRGLLEDEHFNKNVKGVVLTLDTWLSMAGPIHDDVLELAGKIASEKDPNIQESDRIPVLFCPIKELEDTLIMATESSFFEALDAAAQTGFRGWQLSSVYKEIVASSADRRRHPFESRLHEVLPWWGGT